MFSTMRFERSNRSLFQLIKNGLLKLPLEIIYFKTYNVLVTIEIEIRAVYVMFVNIGGLYLEETNI